MEYGFKVNYNSMVSSPFPVRCRVCLEGVHVESHTSRREICQDYILYSTIIPHIELDGPDKMAWIAIPCCRYDPLLYLWNVQFADLKVFLDHFPVKMTLSTTNPPIHSTSPHRRLCILAVPTSS